MKTYLKPDDPAGDMAEALVRQGDALAELSAKLESALYPSKSAAERGALYNNGGGGVMDRGTTRLLENADARADALVAASRDEMCDVTKVAVALLASSDVVASSEGVVTRARLPETDGPSRTVVYANPMDVRSALAQVIDVALMSSPRDAVVDVCVCEASADGFVDVEVNVDTSNVSLSIEARMSERTAYRNARVTLRRVSERVRRTSTRGGAHATHTRRIDGEAGISFGPLRTLRRSRTGAPFASRSTQTNSHPAKTFLHSAASVRTHTHRVLPRIGNASGYWMEPLRHR